MCFLDRIIREHGVQRKSPSGGGRVGGKDAGEFATCKGKSVTVISTATS